MLFFCVTSNPRPASSDQGVFSTAGGLGWGFSQSHPHPCCWGSQNPTLPTSPLMGISPSNATTAQLSLRLVNGSCPFQRCKNKQIGTISSLALQVLYGPGSPDTHSFSGSKMGQDMAETSAIDLCIMTVPANNCLFENPLSPPPSF